MSDFVTSLIRTWVPVGVGLVVGWVVSTGLLDVSAEDQAKVTAWAVSAATALYYAGVRALERKWPWFGNLLGKATEPRYPG